jgi:hypothetical protein
MSACISAFDWAVCAEGHGVVCIARPTAAWSCRDFVPAVRERCSGSIARSATLISCMGLRGALVRQITLEAISVSNRSAIDGGSVLEIWCTSA